MSDGTHSGGCLCGAVRFEAEGALRPVVACHCRQCRRQSGHHFAATSTTKAALHIFDPAGALRWYNASADAARGFCGTCGSALFWWPADRDSVGILAGSLDEPTGLTLVGHVYVAGKGDYYEIADGLPQYPGSGAAQLTEGWSES